MTIAATAEPAKQPTDRFDTLETGATFGDAKRLCRKAQTIILKIAAPDRTHITVHLPPRTFARLIRFKGDNNPAPCELWRSNRDNYIYLTVGR